MSGEKRKAWEAKVDFAARRLADCDGRDFDRLPSTSRWFASKVRYRWRAGVVLGAGNLWDMKVKYDENTS